MTSSVNVEQLLHQCQGGDEESLARIIRHFEQRLYRFALRVSGDTTLAEEAVVQTFYKIWCKAGQCQGQTSAEAWIYRIAARTVLDLQRGQKRWQRRLRLAASVRPSVSGSDPLETLAARELQQERAIELEQAIKTLAEEDRALIHLYYDEQRRLSDIALILDKTQGALKMRLARARKRLREALENLDHASRL